MCCGKRTCRWGLEKAPLMSRLPSDGLGPLWCIFRPFQRAAIRGGTNWRATAAISRGIIGSRNVRSWHLADIPSGSLNVRFQGQSGHRVTLRKRVRL